MMAIDCAASDGEQKHQIADCGSAQTCLHQALVLPYILVVAPSMGILLQHHLRGIEIHLIEDLVLDEK